MNEQETPQERPTPRSTTEIFGDLQALAHEDGALHEISAIVYRDWVVTVDTREGRVVDDPGYRWSTSKLNRNELMLVLGLMVQSPTNKTYAVQTENKTFAYRVDRLLRELHDRIVSDGAPTYDNETQTLISHPDSIGLIAREAIYYGADSFYLHQFPRFSRQRYREDGTWLLQNVGISIRPIIDIARFIVDRINNQMTVVGHMRKERTGCLNNFSASISGASAGVRLPSGGAAG